MLRKQLLNSNNLESARAKALLLPGSAGDYASTPDSAALDVTGDIEGICYVAATDWTPAGTQSLGINKSLNTGSQRAWQFNLLSTGIIQVITFSDGLSGSSASSTAAPTITDGSGIWLRFTKDVDDGAAGNTTTFYTSTDGPTTAPLSVSWTMLGVAVTNAGTTSIQAGTAEGSVGAINAGGVTQAFNGKIYRAQVYNGIGGTLVADFDPRRVAPGQKTLTDSVGNVWTTNGTARLI